VSYFAPTAKNMINQFCRCQVAKIGIKRTVTVDRMERTYSRCSKNCVKKVAMEMKAQVPCSTNESTHNATIMSAFILNVALILSFGIGTKQAAKNKANLKEKYPCKAWKALST